MTSIARAWLGGTSFRAMLVVSLAAASCTQISPVAVTPPEAPALTGPTAPNTELEKLEKVPLGDARGPEELAFDAQGRIYTGTLDGTVHRLTRRPAGGADIEALVSTGGRPLGMAFDASGRLIVCDAVKGLLAVDRDAKVSVLTTEADGVPFKFTDALDIAADGAIYFSDATSKWGIADYMMDYLEGLPRGRLLRYRPDTGKTEVLAKDLYFANGVALSHQEDFVLVNETWAYRVQRYWLTGPKAGTLEPFAENLPGFPDGISRGPRGTYWVALFTVRDPLGDWAAPHPTIKWIFANLPRFLMPGPKPYGFALELDADGKIVRSLQDPSGDAIQHVSSVREHAGSVYLGTLDGPHIGRYPLTGP